MSVWRRLSGTALPATALTPLAIAMSQFESGSSPTALSVQNNNPLNLMYAGQPGATPGPGGFAMFSSYDAGLQAGISQINLDLSRGTDANGNPVTTLAQLINSWSPPSAPGNSPASTSNYVQYVASATGLDPNADLASQLAGVAGAAASGAPGYAASQPLDSTGSSLPDVSTASAIDPTTLLLLAGAGVLAWIIWGRN